MRLCSLSWADEVTWTFALHGSILDLTFSRCMSTKKMQTNLCGLKLYAEALWKDCGGWNKNGAIPQHYILLKYKDIVAD